MRKRGMSYSEIENRLSIPKSTLCSWLKTVPLTDEQLRRLDEKRRAVARANAERRMERTDKTIEAIWHASAHDVKNISKRELWLMGIALCWNRTGDFRKGVHFTSSDPHLVKLFLQWLRDVGQIDDDELQFDIFMRGRKGDAIQYAIDHWARVTNFSEERFSHIYFQKGRKRDRGKSTIEQKPYLGMLRVRVRASSLLARQIAGWIHGIRAFYWGKTSMV